MGGDPLREGTEVCPVPWLRCPAAVAFFLAVSLLSAVSLPAQEDLRAKAEEAFHYDRYPEAIELYKQIVARSPRDTFSLKRLALILSWEDRLDESISTYRQLLEVDPTDDEARRELAKIYSWGGRYAESEAIYRQLLGPHPKDAALKLSLAEVLGWQGRYGDARAVYQELIDSKDHAVAAAVGMGDLASWEGDLASAAQWYRQVLKADPGNERARLGLARVHHWQGLDRAAVREVDSALQRFPESKEARKLHDEIHFSLKPALTPGFDRTLDTDSNDLMASRIGLNLHTDPQTTLDLHYAHYEAQFRCKLGGHCPGVVPGAGPLDPIDARAEAEADSVGAVLNTRFSDILYLTARLGVDRLETFDGRGRNGLVGGGSFDLYPTHDFGFGFAYTHESLVDTARLIANDLRLDAATGRLDYRFARVWRLRGSAQHAWFSDDNQRNVAHASLEVRLPWRRPRTRVTYSARWLSYREDFDNGYFDPQRFLANLITVSLGDELFHRRLYYAVEGTGGSQRFRPRPTSFASGADDTVFGWNLLGGINLSRRLAFEASYGRTDYAQQSATGFESRHYGYLLKIVF